MPIRTTIGEPTLEALVTTNLSARLEVVDWWKQHPELGDEKIVEPVFIVGVSRSGTTALSHLLSVDPAVRAPRRVGDPVTGASAGSRAPTRPTNVSWLRSRPTRIRSSTR